MGAEPGVTVAVVGAVGAGIVYHLPRMPENGETLLTATIQVVPGGKASNHAIGLRRLGAGVRLFSAAGRDPFAQQARAAWRAEELDARGVVELDGVPSLIGSVLVDAAGDNRIVIGTGAMGRYTAEHVQAFATEIAACDLLLVSLEMPAAPGLRALRIARDAGITTILNPAPAPSAAEAARLLPLCDWVTPNRAEAVAMTGLSDPRAAAVRLRELGAGGVVVTLGGDGALLLGDGEELAVPAMRVEVLDTSGAGDAFNCAFALAIAQGLPAGEAARHGCLAAGLIVQGPNFTDALRLWDRLPRLLGGPQAPPRTGGPQAPPPTGGPEVPPPAGPTAAAPP
jgi:ribokinase